jgi:hypothetical protein
MTIQAPITKPIASLFKWKANFIQTLYLYPTSGEIQLGADMAQYPLEASLYWNKGRLNILVIVGPKGMTLEDARAKELISTGRVELGENATTRDVWAMARALCIVLAGGVVEVTNVIRDLENDIDIYPMENFIDATGRGTCPECGMRLPWLPAFPVNAIRRCPGCRAMILYRSGRLEVKKSQETDNR